MTPAIVPRAQHLVDHILSFRIPEGKEAAGCTHVSPRNSCDRRTDDTSAALGLTLLRYIPHSVVDDLQHMWAVAALHMTQGLCHMPS